jgi:hypothetical protein
MNSHFYLRYMASIVFKSPVKSGFLTPKGATVDRNRSKPLPILRGPQPNRIGPVLFGSVAPKRPVETGLNRYFYSKYLYYMTNYIITLRAGARRGVLAPFVVRPAA